MQTFTIIGCGAIGLFIGSKLLDINTPLNFVARSNYTELKINGFTVTENDNTTTHYEPTSLFNKIDTLPRSDIIFLTTTVEDNKTFLTDIKNILHKNSIVISLQNGIDFEK